MSEGDQNLPAPPPSAASWLELAANDDPARRLAAVRALTSAASSLRRSRAVAVRLAALLDDPSRQVRIAAAMAFWQVRSSSAIEPLARLSAEPNELGVVALAALAHQQSDQANRALAELGTAWARRNEDLALWLRALGWSGNEAFIPLIEPYLSHVAWSLRWSAALALAELGHEQGVLELDTLLADPEAPDQGRSDRIGAARRMRQRWQRLQHERQTEHLRGVLATPHPDHGTAKPPQDKA